jgi:Uncharacterized conserved protein
VLCDSVRVMNMRITGSTHLQNLADSSQVSPNSRARTLIRSLPGEPLFLADWLRLLMIHYEVDPKECQKLLPFELDLYHGSAWISLVAFTLSNMRPRWIGIPGAWLIKPISTHEFLNVRTYVKVRGEAGIYFLAEWLSNRLSVLLGPRIFGLPYRFGRISYQHQSFADPGSQSGTVLTQNGRDRLDYCAELNGAGPFREATPGSLDEWLLERYSAFTYFRSKARFFRVWHEPYHQKSATVSIYDQSLIENSWPLLRGAKPAKANFSPGVAGVWMGRPHRLDQIIRPGG